MLPFNDDGELCVEALPSLMSPRTKLICTAWTSNVLGTINPIEAIAAIAHSAGIPVLVDGAQAVPHSAIDVQKSDCDFFAFSGHKIYAPTGIGVLYAKEKWLAAMPPYQGGGDMVANVTFAQSTYADLPYKFEAGTANYVGAIGLGAAIDFVENVGIEKISSIEQDLLAYATQALNNVKGLKIFGAARNKAPVLSFIIDGAHHLDVGQILDQQGIAVRTGTLCAQPVMQRYGTTGMLRASMAFYNTREEIDALAAALVVAKRLLCRQ
jgi:cysteine desulfurase/selenocysteine lyase